MDRVSEHRAHFPIVYQISSVCPWYRGVCNIIHVCISNTAINTHNMFVLKHVFIRGIFSYIFCKIWDFLHSPVVLTLFFTFLIYFFRFEKMFKHSLVFTFLISLCWIYDYDLVGQYVCKYVCMSRLALFICISGTIL